MSWINRNCHCENPEEPTDPSAGPLPRRPLSAFERIAAGAKDAIAIARGEADPKTYRLHPPPEIDVKKIRKKQRLTQVEFAERHGLNVARIRDWGQRRSHPDSAARAYLTVIAREPEAVSRALGEPGAA